MDGTRFTERCEQYNVDITVRRVQSLQYSVNSTRWTVQRNSTTWAVKCGQEKVDSKI